MDTYIRFLEKVKAPLNYVVSEVNNGHFPASVDKCDAYLVSGSVNGTYDDQPRIGELMQFVRSGDKAGIKLVGICFGHQLLAHALAGLAGNGRALPGKRSS